MHAVLYRSRARPGLVAADLNAIVGAARAYNGPAGLTGVLLYGELDWVPGAPGEFVQWIEGPERAVAEAMARVRADRRHSGVEVLASGPVAEVAGAARRGRSRPSPDRLSPDRSGRLFPTWSMGLVRLAELPATAEGFLEAAGRWR